MDMHHMAPAATGLATGGWPWAALLLLGAVHGVNPGMGWLFAVALGMQRQERRAVWRALLPLAAGHAAAIAVVAVAVALVGVAVPLDGVRWIVAGVLLAFGMSKLVRTRHPRFGGMAVKGREIAAWSFLMASAHGAGLMVVPFLLRIGRGTAFTDHTALTDHSAHTDHAVQLASVLPPIPAAGLGVALVHTVGYLLVTGLIAVVVYERLGLRMLTRAWFNVDRLWAGALIATAVATPVLA